MRALTKPRGFTLIELLIIIAIIGILAGLAIPQFAVYRKRAFDARMQADARSGGTAEEAYFATFYTYQAGDCSTLPGFKGSADVTCTADVISFTNFTITTTATNANFTTCVFNNANAPNLICN